MPPGSIFPRVLSAGDLPMDSTDFAETLAYKKVVDGECCIVVAQHGVGRPQFATAIATAASSNFVRSIALQPFFDHITPRLERAELTVEGARAEWRAALALMSVTALVQMPGLTGSMRRGLLRMLSATAREAALGERVTYDGSLKFEFNIKFITLGVSPTRRVSEVDVTAAGHASKQFDFVHRHMPARVNMVLMLEAPRLLVADLAAPARRRAVVQSLEALSQAVVNLSLERSRSGGGDIRAILMLPRDAFQAISRESYSTEAASLVTDLRWPRDAVARMVRRYMTSSQELAELIAEWGDDTPFVSFLLLEQSILTARSAGQALSVAHVESARHRLITLYSEQWIESLANIIPGSESAAAFILRLPDPPISRRELLAQLQRNFSSELSDAAIAAIVDYLSHYGALAMDSSGNLRRAKMFHTLNHIVTEPMKPAAPEAPVPRPRASFAVLSPPTRRPPAETAPPLARSATPRPVAAFTSDAKSAESTPIPRPRAIYLDD